MTAKPAIVLDSLSYRYTGNHDHALDGVSLEVPDGTVTAVLGPNGSGKTTLMHLLLGIFSPTGGRISLEGRPRQDYSRRALSQMIALVPQDEYLPFEFSVVEYVTLGRAPHLGLMETPSAGDRQAAEEALQTVGIPYLRARSITSLSGGEKQLAMVARAIVQSPRIMLLDEPTSHLDLANRRRVLQVLSSLAGRGVTIVFTTHDPNAAAAVASHIILLRGGRTLAAGPLVATFNSANLSATYGVDINVVPAEGQLVVLS